MKKTIIKITALALMLVLTLSVAGCRLFSFENGSIEDLPHSTEKLGNVVYGTIDGERTLKDKTEVIKLLDFRLYYRASVIKIAEYWHKKRHRLIEQNRQPEINPHSWSTNL